MALLSQSKTLAGSRAFSGLRARVSPVVSNGSSRVTMKRKDSYMVEVNVGEDEPEDIAVRKFMKKVMESGVIEELRNRRYKETPLQEWKRRTRERIAARKMGIRLPTWAEEYGIDPEVRPFDEFFQRDPESTSNFVTDFLQQYEQAPDSGGYMDSWNQDMRGGYMSPMGGYMSPDQAGGYAQPGGYMSPDQAGGYAQPGGYMMPQDAGAYSGYVQDPNAYGQVVYTDPAYTQQPEYQQPVYSQPPPQQGGYQ